MCADGLAGSELQQLGVLFVRDGLRRRAVVVRLDGVDAGADVAEQDVIMAEQDLEAALAVVAEVAEDLVVSEAADQQEAAPVESSKLSDALW